MTQQPDSISPHRQRTLGAGASLIALLTLGGCATVQSEARTSTASIETGSGGLTYFLPQRLVRLTASKEPIDLAKLTETRGEADATLKAATTALKKAKTARAKADALAAAMPVGVEGRGDQLAVAALALAEETLATSDVATAKSDLAGAQAALDAARVAGTACTYKAALELLPAQPDVDKRFVARLRHNWFRDDTTALKVSANGLLTSANVVAVDRTGDIIVEAAGAISGLGAKGAKAMLSPPLTKEDCSAEPLTLMTVFDPLTEKAKANGLLQSARYPFRFEVAAPQKPSDAASVQAERLHARRQGGLFYRSSAPVALTLQRQGADGQFFDSDTAIAMLPQAGPINFIPANSSAFVKTVDDAEFADGSLVSWKTERPSEAFELVRLPVKVATSIVSVPAQMLSLKVDYSSKAKALADAQAGQAAAQQSLRRLRDCVAVAQAEGSDGKACFTAAN